MHRPDLWRAFHRLESHVGQLAARGRHYFELFDLAPEAQIVTDCHGTIVEVNRAAAALLRRRADRLIGKPLAALVALESRSAFRSQPGCGSLRLLGGPQVGYRSRAILDAQGVLAGRCWMLDRP
jgi:PAS domain S-box-containing protein